MPSMSSPPSPLLPNWPAPSLRRRFAFDWRTALLRAFLPIAALLAPPGLGIGALIWWRTSKTWDYRERWSGTRLLAIVGLVVYGAITWVAHPLPSMLHALFVGRRESFLITGLREVGEMWLLHLCFAPTCALILEWLHPLTRRVRLLPRERVPRRGKAGSVSTGHPSASSTLSLVPAPPPSTSSPLSPPPLSSLQPSSISQPPIVQPPPAEPLGLSLGGDLYEWLRGGQLCLPPEEMWRHGTVVGEPGYGKTMTLLRLATIAVRYGMQVIFLDLKGSKKTAAQFVAAMHLLGVGRIAVYPKLAYDGWRGDATALYNRLMAMIDPGTHPYYRRITSALVSLAVHAPGGPPRSSQEFLARLDERWLRYAYAGKTHWYAQRKIKKLSEHISETSLTYDGFFDGVAGGLDGAFAYEDADAVYIGLDGDALKEQAVNTARYLLEDAAHYAKHRKASGVRALCIIDEFGALGISNVAGLYEHMREAGLSMWASAQSYAGLGSERDNVLAASSIKILHRCGDPEELVKFAGQREVPAFSQILDDERDARSLLDEPARAPSRRTTVHMQRQYAVPIEDVQQLALGTIALITGGLHAWVQVYPVALPEDLLRMATAFVSAPPEEPSAPIVPPPPTRAAPKKAPGRTQASAGGKDRKSQEAKPPEHGPAPPSSPAQASGQRPTAEEDDSPVDF
jgi:hypothetical protein